MKKDINNKTPINQKEKNIFSGWENRKDDLLETLKKWVEKGKIKIELTDKKYELETTSYTFEYPEKIQEETGILGYERVKISNDAIEKYIRSKYEIEVDYLRKKYWFIISIKSLEEISKYFKGEMDKIKKEKDRCGRKIENKNSEQELYNDYGKIDDFNEKCLRDILYSISNGEYPYRCFVHEMGAYYKKPEQQKFCENFSKNKYFLQKIYDLEYIKEKKVHFNNVADGYHWSNITVFNTQTGEMVGRSEMDIINLAEEEYYTWIKNKNLFACTPNSWFNINVGDSFFRSHINLSNKNPFFCYPMDKNSFFYKYLNKALDIYINKLKGFDFKETYDDGAWLNYIIQEIILCDPEVQKNLFQKDSDNKIKGRKIEDSSKKELIMKLGIDIINWLESKFNVDFSKFFNSNKWDWRKKLISRICYYTGSGGGKYELRLPIFIGLDSIPQLSWGHAEYAHYMDEKGLNFFKFRHTDHLPTKE